MDGSDLPPGGSGKKPPSVPPGSRKRKHGADASPATPAGPSSSSPTTARRSSKPVMTSAVSAWVRSAAAGRLWRTTLGRGSGRGHGDKETMREAILHVRRGRSVLAPDDPASPYREPRPAAVSKAGKPSPGPGPVTRSQGRLLQGQQQQGLAAGVALQGQQVLAATVASKLRWVRSAATGTLWATPGGDLADVERTREEFLSLSQARSILAPYLEQQKNISYLSTLRKNIVLDPIKYQASVPEWENAPSEKDIADYKSDGETSQKLGEVVWPLNTNNTPTYQLPNTRKGTSGKCKCPHSGSEACVIVHVQTARSSLKNQLGKKAFRNCGLDAMGEQALSLWTKANKEGLGEIEQAIPQNKHGKFMKIVLAKIALEKISSEEPKKDLVNYYYNVFLPRRLASLTRAENINAKDVDTDGDSDEDHPEKKTKSSGSSRRSRK